MKFTPAKPPLTGETLDSLTEKLRERGEPAFRAKQILDWVYKKRARSWAAGTRSAGGAGVASAASDDPAGEPATAGRAASGRPAVAGPPVPGSPAKADTTVSIRRVSYPRAAR